MENQSSVFAFFGGMARGTGADLYARADPKRLTRYRLQRKGASLAAEDSGVGVESDSFVVAVSFRWSVLTATR